MSLLKQLDTAYASNPDPDYIARMLKGPSFPLRADLLFYEMVEIFGDITVCIQSLKPSPEVHMKYFSRVSVGMTPDINQAQVLTLREAYSRHLGYLRQLVHAP